MKWSDHDYEDSWEKGLGSLFLSNVDFLIFFPEGAFSLWRNYVSEEHILAHVSPEKTKKNQQQVTMC